MIYRVIDDNILIHSEWHPKNRCYERLMCTIVRVS